MVQKEVSGKDVSGAGGAWAEERRDLAAFCSRDMRCSSSRCCHAIPCTCSLQGAAGVCPNWHLSVLGINMVPVLPWAPESLWRGVRPGLMPRRCLSPPCSRVVSHHVPEGPSRAGSTLSIWPSSPSMGLSLPGACGRAGDACLRPGHRGCPPVSAQALTVANSPSLGFRLIPEAWHLRWRSSTSSTGTCTCSVVVLCAAAVGPVHAGVRAVSSHLCPIPSCSPSHPVSLLCPPEPALVEGSRKAAAATVLHLGLDLGHGFLQFGVSHGEA